ncbi:hypothetical protein CPSG_06782, partial [Coccidioides posadasii str. Silveira]
PERLTVVACALRLRFKEEFGFRSLFVPFGLNLGLLMGFGVQWRGDIGIFICLLFFSLFLALQWQSCPFYFFVNLC